MAGPFLKVEGEGGQPKSPSPELMYSNPQHPFMKRVGFLNSKDTHTS